MKGTLINFFRLIAIVVKVYLFPDRLLYKGKNKMRETYSKIFADTPNLKCEIIKRIIHGSTVIDQEKITGSTRQQSF